MFRDENNINERREVGRGAAAGTLRRASGAAPRTLRERIKDNEPNRELR